MIELLDDMLNDPVPNRGGYWHIIWTTHGYLRPDDSRGDWSSLGCLYQSVGSDIPVYYSRLLPKVWTPVELHSAHVSLSESARSQVVSDIKHLSTHDRIAGDMPVYAVSVQRTYVQLVVKCDFERLSQKIGRLKSRTATLLSFVRDNRVGGANTWAKGFWCAGFLDEALQARVVQYVQNV